MTPVKRIRYCAAALVLLGKFRPFPDGPIFRKSDQCSIKLHAGKAIREISIQSSSAQDCDFPNCLTSCLALQRSFATMFFERDRRREIYQEGGRHSFRRPAFGAHRNRLGLRDRRHCLLCRARVVLERRLSRRLPFPRCLDVPSLVHHRHNWPSRCWIFG